ncbi:MAG: transcription antitermination factor NusB [Planctomycetota bacterium]|nr:MAG: transcription antitermination factor NusB [Planctomycetota bacterium]REJ94367.1 MAG: transcription antitermination factor NusB [Planctomycetota bacterium]REK22101.1 MAG: transcription antitermination factor NusB [Planctomycetota bacterium]REK44508.1 MAG: transcription antitermination factor NusB [Planctomycetota bacterium]
MSRRSRSREFALQILYQDDVNPGEDLVVAEPYLRSRLNKDDLLEFSLSLVSGVRRNREELDELLNRVAENWTLQRMAVTDRNVLRIGAYEILYTTTPVRVVLNEAVELAKRFGSRQSAQFVNGVLDRVLSECGRQE